MKVLAEKEAEDLLEKEGFPVAKREVVYTEKELLKSAKKIGYPLVLKVHSKTIIHKSDVGGVKLDVRNEKEANNMTKKLIILLFKSVNLNLSTILNIIKNNAANHSINDKTFPKI